MNIDWLLLLMVLLDRKVRLKTHTIQKPIEVTKYLNKAFISLILFMVFFTLPVNAAFCSNIYADNILTDNIINGSYSISERDDSGSDGDAYTTIKEAVKHIRPGDTLFIRGGTYIERNISISNLRSGSSDAWYTIKSYPGEWAVVDGKHSPESGDFIHCIFYGTTAGGQQGFIKFENLEITGAGYDVDDSRYPSGTAAGVKMRGGPFIFRRLYIHNNYGDDNNNCAGLMLENGTGDSLIEYCYFKANGEVKCEAKDRSTSVANLIINSDYKYRKPLQLYDPKTGYCTATQGNEIRYCLFEADAGNGHFTTTGFKHKGMQRLTGYLYSDQKSPDDNFPNDDSWKFRGDKIHHNIFIDHMVGIEIDQDYTQVYNNILLMKNWGVGPHNAIQGRDANCSRRGPFNVCIYNNTIVANGLSGIVLHLVPDGWSGNLPYIKCYIVNNIVDGAFGNYDLEDISIESDNVNATDGYPLSNLIVDRNYFYNPPDNKLIYIHLTKYTEKEIESTLDPINMFSNYYNSNNPLYAGTSMPLQLKTFGTHILEGNITIADSGLGGRHPYISGVIMPSYVGATSPYADSGFEWDPSKHNPNDSGWVDYVFNVVGRPSPPKRLRIK